MLETVGVWTIVSVIATLTLALVVPGTPYFHQLYWLPGFAMGVIGAMTAFIAVFALGYYVNLREMRRALLISLLPASTGERKQRDATRGSTRFLNSVSPAAPNEPS